jgi:hypothetical protein
MIEHHLMRATLAYSTVMVICFEATLGVNGVCV